MKFFPKGIEQRCAFIVTTVTILCGVAAVVAGSTLHYESYRWVVIGVGLFLIVDNGRLLWKHREWLWPKS